MKQVNIKHVSSVHNNALSSLSFYEQEITVLQKRLDEIASKNTGREAEEGIGYFQNEFIIHQEKIDELKHAFHENQHQLEAQLTEMAGYAGEDTLRTNEQLFDDYLTEEKLLNGLRHEFLRFAAKWM